MSRKNTVSTELIPPEGSEGVGPAVMKMLEEILKYRDDIKFAERCVRFYQLRKNRHWKNKNPNLKLVSGNLLGSHHQKTVNMLTDNNPTFNAIQAGELGEDGEDKLSILTNTIDHWYIEEEQQHVLEESVHVGELYGAVGEFASYNEDINYPTGEVEIETLDPMYYSLYPPKCRQVRKAEAFLKWYPLSVREARRKWPDAADRLSGDMSLLQEIGDDRHQDEQRPEASRKQVVLSTLTRWLSGSKQSSGEDDSDDLFVIETWVKDYSGKYPGNIRRVRIANGGDIVLDDDWNPSINPGLDEKIQQENYLYSRFPVSHNQSVTDPSSPFGFADFEQLEQLNIEFNKTMSQFTMFKDRSSRTKLINPKDSGVSNDELDSRPGIINPTNHLVAQAIQYVQPPQMGTDIPAALSLYKDIFHEIAGSFQDVMQGQKAGSEVVAAKAIAMLLEEASRMARGKIRNYSKMIRERGRMYIALAQSWYQEPRYVKVQQKGQNINIPVNRDVLQIPGKINVVVGSTMPISHIQRREEAISLAKLGAIDQEELLKSFNWDNYKDVVARMKQGPMGQFIQKLALIGIPQPMLQLFQQIGQLDEKEIERGLKAGKIPPFIEIIKQIAGQQQQAQTNPELMKVQIDAEKAKAEIQKILSEAELTKQKIETEIVEREIKKAGVEFDKENIRIEKAKAVASIQSMKESQRIQKYKTASDIAERDHREREDGENRKERLDMRQDTGGYDERGMKSNNEVVE